MSKSHYNPPLRSSLSYRQASHPELLRRMLAALHGSDPLTPGTPALSRLTTRSGDDLSVAFLDAFATTLDVLHFYQERIANQAFLRTATEQRALQELAYALGCPLAPGVAASTILAFFVDNAPQSSGMSMVPRGTRVQNAPVSGQRTQTFETVADLHAQAAWNALRPRRRIPSNLELQSRPTSSRGAQQIPSLRLWDPEGGYRSVASLYLQGTATRLQKNDLLLLECSASPLASPQEPRALAVRVKEVLPDPRTDRTAVVLDLADPTEQVAPPQPPSGSILLDSDELRPEKAPATLMGSRFTERDLSAQIAIAGIDPQELTARIADLRDQPATHLRVYALRQSLACFGSAAPLYDSLPQPPKGDTPWGPNWDTDRAGVSVFYDSHGELYSLLPGRPDIVLERPVTEITAGSYVVLQAGDGSTCVMRVTQASSLAVTGFGSTGRGTALSLQIADISRSDKLNADTIASTLASFTVRSTNVLCQSEPLPLAPFPVSSTIAPGDPLTLETMTLGLSPGQHVIVSGEWPGVAGQTRTEVARIAEISHFAGYTTLRFLKPFQNSYTTDSLVLCANAVPATHGETRTSEIIGSGDHSKLHQQFPLRSAPLTFVSAASADGVTAELEVRVGDVLWEEVPSLYGQPPGRNCYALLHAPDGTTVVCFGDGINGARLPSGQDNVVATYRTGLGKDGLLAADTLTLLPGRPAGIKSVRNPLPTEGAADPAGPEQLRNSAPRWVRTLDRIVSLRDYEDLALSFAGIGKARALLLRSNNRPLVHLTIAGVDGAAVSETSDLHAALMDAYRSLGAKQTDMLVKSYARRLFSLRAQLSIDPRYVAAKVLASARAALLNAYSFPRRGFGQPVAVAEVLEIVQSTEGVRAATLLSFRGTTLTDEDRRLFPAVDASQAPPAVLSVEDVEDVAQTLGPLGLLLLHPAGVELEVMR